MIRGSNQSPVKRWKLKEKALRLRSKGLSYNEIIEKIPVTKSTMSLWCRHIDLTAEQKNRLLRKSRESGLAGVKAIQTMFWQKRCDAFREGAELSYKLSPQNPKFVAGLMLYWAEGTKKSSTAVTNSDPRIIKFMALWLKEFFGIKPEQLSMGFHFHPGQNEDKIKNYWTQVTNIPLANFRKNFMKPEGSKYRKNVLQNGTAKLIVRTKGSTYLLFKLLGAINGFLGLTINEKIEPEDWISKLPYAKTVKLNLK